MIGIAIVKCIHVRAVHADAILCSWTKQMRGETDGGFRLLVL